MFSGTTMDPGQTLPPRSTDVGDIARRQAELAERLVRLEDVPLPELDREVRLLRRSLLFEHSRGTEPWLRDMERQAPAQAHRVDRLRSDHRIFRSSMEQLEWFRSIVEAEDHGGNRQALGQYWKILIESILRHLEEEWDLASGGAEPGRAGFRGARSGQR
jgi:hypothetical protein